jgi:hypothetical protein
MKLLPIDFLPWIRNPRCGSVELLKNLLECAKSCVMLSVKATQDIHSSYSVCSYSMSMKMGLALALALALRLADGEM